MRRTRRRRRVVARDHLAGKEMEVGRYYYQQGSYLAGINRFKRVVTEYRNTSQTPEALYRLAEGYMALGIVSEAQTAAAVLGHNYPQFRMVQGCLPARLQRRAGAGREQGIAGSPRPSPAINPL